MDELKVEMALGLECHWNGHGCGTKDLYSGLGVGESPSLGVNESLVWVSLMAKVWV